MTKRFQKITIFILVGLLTCLFSIPNPAAEELDTTPPTIPGQLNYLDLTDSSLVLTWSESNDDAGVEHYKIYQNGTYVGYSIEPTFLSTSLLPDTNYEYSVSAVDMAANESPLSECVVIKTLLPKVQNITATETLDSIALSWDSQDGAISYEVMADSTTPESISLHTYCHTGLTSGSAHTYKVRSITPENVSAWSDEVQASTLISAEFSITGKALDTFIDFTWEPLDGAETYDLDMDGTIISGLTETKYRYESLMPNSAHSVKIRAITNNNMTSWSEPYLITTMPQVPIGGTITQSTTYSALSVYIVNSSLTVPEGVTLTMEPGTVLKFKAGTTLYIQGRVDISANEGQEVIFTAFKDKAFGGIGLASTSDYWSGIHVKPSGTLDATYAKFYYSKGFRFDASYRTIVAEGGTILNNICLENISGSGIYSASGNLNLEVRNSVLKNISGESVLLASKNSGSYSIINNTIEVCGYGIYCNQLGNGTYSINNNSINGCSYGIYLYQFNTELFDITQNQIGNSTVYPFYINLSLLNVDIFSGIQDNTITTTNELNDIVLAGTLKINLFWDQGRYIAENLTIPQGINLTLSSNVVLRVGIGKTVTVNGCLNLNGNTEFPAVLTSIKDPEYGGRGSTNILDTWSCIIKSTGELKGNYSRIKYGGRYYDKSFYLIVNEGILNLQNSYVHTIGGATGIKVNTSKEAYINNCSFESGNGIVINAANNTLITDSKFTSLNYGITNYSPDDVEIRDCVFSNCYIAIYNKTANVGNFIVENNTLQDCSASGIKIEQFGTGQLSIRENSLTRCSRAMHVILSGLGTSIFEGIKDNIFAENMYVGDAYNLVVIQGSPTIDIKLTQGKYYLWGQLTIPTEKSFFVDSNVTIYTSSSINVNGSLVVNGTDQHPAVFGTLNDPIYGVPEFSYERLWSGISITSTGSLIANNMIIRNAYKSVPSLYCGLYVEGKLQFYNSEISRSYVSAYTAGLYLNTITQPIIKFNNFNNNTYGVYNQIPSTITVDATYNYWGSTSGPGSNFNKVSSGVDYIPFLGQEVKYELNFGISGVNAPSGNYSKTFTDLSLKTAGFDLSMARTYNSGDQSEDSILGKGWTFAFQGSIEEITPRAGIYKVKLPNGSVAIFIRNADGSHTSMYSHDTLEKNPLGEYILTTKEQLRYGYDTIGKLMWMKDRNDNTIAVNYDSQGFITSVADPANRTFQLGYSDGKLTSITDPMGNICRYEYENGNLVRFIDSMGYITRYSYDSNGLLAEIKDHDINLIEGITYIQETGENFGKVHQLTNQLGNVTAYSYDTINKKTTMTDSNNRITYQCYDDNFYVTISRDAEGKETKTVYFTDSNGINNFGDIKSITDRNGNKTQYEIDARGNITKQINPDNSFQVMTYDAKNNLRSLVDEIGKTTYYIYDQGMNHLLKEVKPLNGTDAYTGDDDTGFALSHYQYYSDDESALFGYPIKGLIKSVTNPENETEYRTYDSYGNLKTVSDSETGLLKTYVHNILGQKIKEISYLGYVTTFSYDALGRIEKTATGSDETTRFVYDYAGQKIKEISPNQYNIGDDDLANNQYLGDYGNRWIYNSNGTLESFIDSENYVASYTYDIYGNILTETMPNGSIYRYEYDQMDRLTGIWFKNDALSVEIQLDEYIYEILTGGNTRVTQKVFLNDVDTAITVILYDKNGREISKTQPDGTAIITKYLGNGLIESVSDSGGQVTYNRYDGLNRLSEQWVPFEIQSGVKKYTYQKISYDKAGRQTGILSGKETVPLYSVPLSFTVKSLEYYKNGLLKAVYDSDGRRTEYAYDADGTLIKEDVYTSANTKNTTEYVNNHMGKPLQKKVLVRNGDISENYFADNSFTYITTYFTYDKNGNLKTQTTPDNVTTTYEYDNKNQILKTSYIGKNEYSENVKVSISQTLDWQGGILSQTDANGNVTVHTYDKRGDLINTEYPDQAIAAYWYDRAGRKIAEVSPNNFTVGKTLEEMTRSQYTYDNMGRILLEQDIWLNEETSQWETINSAGYLYDANGNVVKKLDSLGYETIYTYNLANLCTAELDPVSAERALPFNIKITYNALGQMIAKERTDGVINHYILNDNGLMLQETFQESMGSEQKVLVTNTWDLAGNLLSRTNSNGNTEYYTYTAFNKVREVTQSGDSTVPTNLIVQQYDSNFNLAMTQNSLGETDLYTYDHQGKVTMETRQKLDETEAVTLSHAYDLNGNLRFDIDGNGSVYSYTYDRLNRMVTRTITAGGIAHTTAFGWDKNGNGITESDWLGNTWVKRYDPLNRLKDRFNPDGVCIEHLDYNSNHLQTASTDALNHTTTYAYDKNNRLIATTDAELHTTYQEWDNVGNLSVKKDGKGNSTTYSYNALGDIIKVTNAKNEITEYTYDLEGNLLTQKDGKGQITSFEYNVRNLPIRRIDHGGRTGAPGSYSYDPTKVEAYTYDAVGRKIGSIDRKGVTAIWQYDCHDNVLCEAVGTDTVSYTYDKNGNTLTMTDSTGTTTYTYDGLNRILTKDAPNIGLVINTWDITTNLPTGFYKHQLKDPKNNVIEKTYDKSGRLYQVMSDSNGATYSYFDNGSCKSVVYNDGSREDYTYTKDNLLETLVNKKNDGAQINRYDYTYDVAHNQVSKTDAKGLTSYEYDALNRLLSVEEPSGKITAYTYDAAGNRLTQSVSEGSGTTLDELSYNEQNRLTAMTTKINEVISESQIYSYDANGNLLATTVNGQVLVENTYDSRNQLMVTSSDAIIVENLYNGDGYRVSKVVGTQIEYFLYDGDRVILELDAKGNTTGRNIYGINLVLREAGNEILYYMYNGHADVTALISNDGQVVGTYDYDPFGNILEHTGTDSPFTYAGYRYDAETELYYLNARMYDPRTARFLQEDTYRGDPNDPLSLNLYTYCHNNPLVYIDPTGHWPDWAEVWDNAVNTFNEGLAVVEDGISYAKEVVTVVKDAALGYGSSLVNTVVDIENTFIFKPIVAVADAAGWYGTRDFFQGQVVQGKKTVNTAIESVVTHKNIYESAKTGMDVAQTVYSAGVLVKGAVNYAMSFDKVSNAVAKTSATIKAATQKVSQSAIKASNKVMTSLSNIGKKLITNQGGYIKLPKPIKSVGSASGIDDVEKVIANYGDDFSTGAGEAAGDVSKLGKYDVGIYNEIKGVSGLDAHHVGQKALMKDFIPDYNPESAPSILVPKVGHTLRGPNGILSRSTSGITNARDLIARDIMELRRVYPDIPNTQLQKLVDMIKELYPTIGKGR